MHQTPIILREYVIRHHIDLLFLRTPAIHSRFHSLPIQWSYPAPLCHGLELFCCRNAAGLFEWLEGARLYGLLPLSFCPYDINGISAPGLELPLSLLYMGGPCLPLPSVGKYWCVGSIGLRGGSRVEWAVEGGRGTPAASFMGWCLPSEEKELESPSSRSVRE